MATTEKYALVRFTGRRQAFAPIPSIGSAIPDHQRPRTEASLRNEVLRKRCVRTTALAADGPSSRMSEQWSQNTANAHELPLGHRANDELLGNSWTEQQSGCGLFVAA